LPAILDNKTGNSGQFLRAKTTTARKRDWRKQELCDGIVTLDMDVGRLAILVRVEEEAIRSVNEDGQHVEMLHGRHSRDHPDPFLAHPSFPSITRRRTYGNHCASLGGPTSVVVIGCQPQSRCGVLMWAQVGCWAVQRQAQFAQSLHVLAAGLARLGAALTGALTGLKADIATRGLTLGGGLLAGGLLGALGAAGLARGPNVMRGRDRDWVGWSDAAMQSIAEAALPRYLAVAHFGRGRGDWAEGETPAHWPEAVRAALALRGADWAAAWAARSTRLDAPGEAERLAALLRPLVESAARAVLAGLYPGTRSDSPAE
jgi:hypothetical protein